MSLYDTKKEFQTICKLYLDRPYEKISINELANNYCKAIDEQDDLNKGIYRAALNLRFWSKQDQLYKKFEYKRIERETCFEMIDNCINEACDQALNKSARAWQDPSKNTNAQACINQIIGTRGLEVNKEGEKNLGVQLSLDNLVDEESNATQSDLVADTSHDANEQVYDMVQALLSDNLIIEAIIADNMAYSDPFKYDKRTVSEVDEYGNEYRYVKQTAEFWPFKLVKELNTLDKKYINYFNKTYGRDLDLITIAVNNIVNMPNQKKYKVIETSRSTMASYI